MMIGELLSAGGLGLGTRSASSADKGSRRLEGAGARSHKLVYGKCLLGKRRERKRLSSGGKRCPRGFLSCKRQR